MGMVSVILIWQEEGRIYSRLTTNVRRERLVAKLSALGLLDAIEALQAFFGDRADGGSGYEVRWKEHVQWDDLQILIRL